MNESVDTNVLLRFVLNDVPEQYVKVRQLLGRPDVVYHVPDMVFFEMEYILKKAHGYSDAMIVETMLYLFGLRQLRCNERVLRPALEMFAAHPKLSFADCCLACYARVNDAEPLWTFDRKLAAQGGSVELVK